MRCVLYAYEIIFAVFFDQFVLYSKDAISGSRGKYLNKKHKSLILFRLLAHLTLTMKLFR